jgi:structure-specific endonuclease subunit SLX1
MLFRTISLPMDKPIPAFYCCYLLRSKNRKSYYIGSTPSPARRLGQHNGDSKGGAKQTSLESKRPWEMTCIVTGFPSKFAALQFEWAWQNTHMTRHIERDVRDARIEDLQKKSKGKEMGGGGRRKRPPMSLEARLKNMHHLLGVKSFERWPLHVRFFALDVFRLWEKYTLTMSPPLRKSITVRLTPAELPVAPTDGSTEKLGDKIPTVIRTIAVAYEDCKAHVEKSRALLGDEKIHACGVCKKDLDTSSLLCSVCPLETCRTVSHMACLSRKFLAEEGNQEALIPVEGTCPGCRTPIKWITLMKELSLRIRGEQEIEAMFKVKRPRKANCVSESESVAPEDLAEDEELDETWIQEVDDEDDDLLSLEDATREEVKAG